MEPRDKIITGPAYITHISPGADLNDIVFAGEFRIDAPEVDNSSTYGVSKDFIIATYYIAAFNNYVIKNCPNRRVIYLALYARKERTRKKNWNRAVRILRRINNA